LAQESRGRWELLEQKRKEKKRRMVGPACRMIRNMRRDNQNYDYNNHYIEKYHTIFNAQATYKEYGAS